MLWLSTTGHRRIQHFYHDPYAALSGCARAGAGGQPDLTSASASVFPVIITMSAAFEERYTPALEETCRAALDERVREEVETLKSILMDDVIIKKVEDRPEIIETVIRPSTGCDVDQQYVCVTLEVRLPDRYPDLSPIVMLRNPRGLDDGLLETLHKKIKQIGDAFIKTQCYHYFHKHCLANHLEASYQSYMEELEKLPNWKRMEAAPFQQTCPVCRSTVYYDVDTLKEAPPPIEAETAAPFELTPEMRALQKKMAAMLKKQEAKGGVDGPIVASSSGRGSISRRGGLHHAGATGNTSRGKVAHGATNGSAHRGGVANGNTGRGGVSNGNPFRVPPTPVGVSAVNALYNASRGNLVGSAFNNASRGVIASANAGRGVISTATPADPAPATEAPGSPSGRPAYRGPY
ncbi:E3 ubiquitin-protein ligase RNF25, partial [Operophtera brumata]